MKGQITTGAFYFRRKIRNEWFNAPVVRDVVVTIDDKGALVDPDICERRALRSIISGEFHKKRVDFELIKYELTGLNLGKTAYNIDAPKIA